MKRQREAPNSAPDNILSSTFSLVGLFTSLTVVSLVWRRTTVGFPTVRSVETDIYGLPEVELVSQFDIQISGARETSTNSDAPGVRYVK